MNKKVICAVLISLSSCATSGRPLTSSEFDQSNSALKAHATEHNRLHQAFLEQTRQQQEAEANRQRELNQQIHQQHIDLHKQAIQQSQGF